MYKVVVFVTSTVGGDWVEFETLNPERDIKEIISEGIYFPRDNNSKTYYPPHAIDHINYETK